MPHAFDPAVVQAILRHMNDDHPDDSALIVRAFGPRADVRAAAMTGLDGDGGDWLAHLADGTTRAVRVAWPGGAIHERAAVRREVVALYDAACSRLGVEPRPHTR
ncbi:MAG: DUF2470 domain-containing protein [Microbacterium sp.]|uniref:DUF2470 domain-containing protein n=1 Tax=Microbacterium sp. TaxID=51671 RepID=UPI0039E2A58F